MLVLQYPTTAWTLTSQPIRGVGLILDVTAARLPFVTTMPV